MSDRPADPLGGSGRRSRPQRRARERRVLWVGLLVSALAHLLVLGLVGNWLEPDPDRSPRRAEPVLAEPPRGMRAVAIATPTEPVPTPDEPEREEPEEEPEPAPEPAPTVARAEPVSDPDTLSAADRLAPRVVDARLWRPMVLLPSDPDIDDVEARIAAAVELLSDSALAEAEAAMRARDWTIEDADGGRWGISPGQLHLGSLTLPLPIWFPVDPESVRAEQQWYELEQQFDRARILDSFQDRVRAIRERRERERNEARGEENGGG